MFSLVFPHVGTFSDVFGCFQMFLDVGITFLVGRFPKVFGCFTFHDFFMVGRLVGRSVGLLVGWSINGCRSVAQSDVSCDVRVSL